MEPINLLDLEHFIGATVEMAIKDVKGGDQAPVLQKKIKKIQYCPDGTHIRFYFDAIYFLAVPLNSEILQTEASFSALDHISGLIYTFKKI
ncbi:hypothetical protein [Bacillus sp. OK048]|uniref:hypothetical protein n=1 Tax=Bacillus sp. OK048 TaxID=1882761 RepID=UPI0008914EA1|nr:hypothetical protein [Bacillus sp. OK048]SDM58329.1 hypothetical protein SAMN05443253_104158 [Bacillus sp. OK048]